MFNERVIQIDGQRVLTNKGRVLECLNVERNVWGDITPTQLTNNYPTKSTPAQFIDAVSPKERFKNATNVGDLLD